MDVQGEYTFDAPRDIVWNALRDIDVLAQVMPGGEDFSEVGENQYTGSLKIKVGPVQGKFKGDIQLSDIVEPESYNIAVDGKGAPGFVKATGGLKLTEQGEQTHMACEGTAQVGGRIASVGQRLMDTSAKAIIRQSLEALNEYVKFQAASAQATQAAETADVAEATEAAEAAEESSVAAAEVAAPVAPKPEMPTYTPPTQAEMAARVAKDVAGELIPAQYRPILIGAVVLIILVILYFIFF